LFLLVVAVAVSKRVVLGVLVAEVMVAITAQTRLQVQ
jgi:hypothetical protein